MNGTDGDVVPPAGSVAAVVELYDRFAHLNYDEAVSQMDHALQTAALARAAGASDEVVLAALLHDVGHLLELRDGGTPDGVVAEDLAHEERGARWLSDLYPGEVTSPIRLHVAAKRYRCAVDPAYHDGLSAGSAASLVRQGGPMSPDEVASFEARPAHAAAVRLRAWDDGGKVDGLEIPGLATYLPLLERLAAS